MNKNLEKIVDVIMNATLYALGAILIMGAWMGLYTLFKIIFNQ